MKKSISILIVLILVSLLAACSGSDKTEQPSSENTKVDDAVKDDASTNDDAAVKEPVKDLSGEITIWTIWKEDKIMPFYETITKTYPNVKVNVEGLAWDEIQNNLKTAIAAGTGGPDIVMFANGWLTPANMAAGVENLLDPPYNAAQLKDKYTDSSWDFWRTLDGKKMIGMPLSVEPRMTIYRADVLEENGYPSDPTELAQYISTPEQFLDMAQALKAKGIYVLENNTTIMDLYTRGDGFFDRNLNYVRNTDKYVEGLRLAQQVKQLGLALGTSAFWSDPGKQAVAAGKLAMYFEGSWILGTIKDTAPDSVGKWKMTQLPFGKAYAGNGMSFAILSQSKNKELAWETLKSMVATDEGARNYVSAGGGTAYKPAWDFPDFKDYTFVTTGDQKINEIMSEAAQVSMNQEVPTMLDAKAEEIWNKGIENAIEKNTDPKAAIQQIGEDIERAVKADKEKLKAEFGIQ
jgi:multiple sugar transport system substrate-binding protein